MALDPDLLRGAQGARERLADAQRAAERARVDYHDAVRRLRAAGGSLREIAEALRLSHQRVHQIVDGREPQQVGTCSFCGRPGEECEKLIAGPGTFICERCVAQAGGLAAGEAVEDRPGAPPMLLEPPGSEVQCSFCGLAARKVRHLVASGPAAADRPGDPPRICDKCLALCEEILAEEAT